MNVVVYVVAKSAKRRYRITRLHRIPGFLGAACGEISVDDDRKATITIRVKPVGGVSLSGAPFAAN